MRWPGTKRKVEALVQAHYAALYRFAFRLSGTASEAEDLTQEAFCQAQAKFGQLRDVHKARGWLFTILRNVYLHKLRDRKTANAVALDEVGDIPDRLPDPLPDIEPQRLQIALSEIPEAFRTPLILFYFEDFSYRDIAEQLEVPLGTVMSRLARAKAFLKARLLVPVAADAARGEA
ncbi:MAG: RNA polymerase sigma factor [Gemmataceae bacterium]|nr:RNA polymerase sigma factor [Gemmataceae bacterium]MCI0737658.1 RNA polymerase sigma factor [Gemmataceae bacterium]